MVEIAPGYFFDKKLFIGIWPAPEGEGSLVMVELVGVLRVDEDPQTIAELLKVVPPTPQHIDLEEE